MLTRNRPTSATKAVIQKLIPAEAFLGISAEEYLIDISLTGGSVL
jgi:hypothetical protein